MQLKKWSAGMACLMLSVSALAQKTAPAPVKRGPAAIQTAPAAPPSDAVQVDEQRWRWTDAKGKSWLYRRTPFGWTKWEEGKDSASEAPKAASEEAKSTLRVEGVEGDVVRFQRQMPFGPSRWTRKIADLTEDERTAYEKSPFAQSAKK